MSKFHKSTKTVIGTIIGWVLFVMLITFLLSIFCTSCTKVESIPYIPCPTMKLLVNDHSWNKDDTLHITLSEVFTIDVSQSIAYGGLSVDTLTIYKETYPHDWIESPLLIYNYSLSDPGAHTLRIGVHDTHGSSDVVWREVIVK